MSYRSPYAYEPTKAEVDEAAKDAAYYAQKLQEDPEGYLNVSTYDDWEPFAWRDTFYVKHKRWEREEQWKQARIAAQGCLMPRFAYH